MVINDLMGKLGLHCCHSPDGSPLCRSYKCSHLDLSNADNIYNLTAYIISM